MDVYRRKFRKLEEKRPFFICCIVTQCNDEYFAELKFEIRGVPGVTRGKRKKGHEVTGSRSFKVTKQKPEIDSLFNCEFSDITFLTFGKDKSTILAPKSTYALGPCQNARGYNSRTLGQIELILANLNSESQITLYTNFEQKVRDEGVIRGKKLSKCRGMPQM